MASFATIIDPIIWNIINPLLELVFAVAVVVFVWGIVEMLLKGGDAEARSTGKKHMFGGVIGMAIMFSAWGIINIVANTVAQFR